MTEQDFVLQWISRLSDVIVGSKNSTDTFTFAIKQAREIYAEIKKAYAPNDKQE